MPTDAFDMAVVHRVFRSELHNAPGLIRDVKAGDIERSAIVGGHLSFIVAALHHHHAAEDELVWSKLRAQAPAGAVEITRMEDAHRGIADDVARVQDIVASWVTSADLRPVRATHPCRRGTLGPSRRAPRGRRAQWCSAHQRTHHA
jgi:hypothetical protein